MLPPESSRLCIRVQCASKRVVRRRFVVQWATSPCSVWFRLSPGLDRPNSSSRTRSTPQAAAALPPPTTNKHLLHSYSSVFASQCCLVCFVGEPTADWNRLGQWVTLVCEFVRKWLQDPIKSEFGKKLPNIFTVIHKKWISRGNRPSSAKLKVIRSLMFVCPLASVFGDLQMWIIIKLILLITCNHGDYALEWPPKDEDYDKCTIEGGDCHNCTLCQCYSTWPVSIGLNEFFAIVLGDCRWLI